MIPAGRRNKRITFQKPVAPASRFTAGETWSAVCTCWASIEPKSGREYWNAQQVQSAVTHRIKILYRAGITADMRIQHGERYFHIASVIDPDERHIELEIIATEVQ